MLPSILVLFYTRLILVLYKLNIISNQRAKEIMLNYFFGKMKAEEFSKHCEKFMSEKLPGLAARKSHG